MKVAHIKIGRMHLRQLLGEIYSIKIFVLKKNCLKYIRFYLKKHEKEKILNKTTKRKEVINMVFMVKKKTNKTMAQNRLQSP